MVILNSRTQFSYLEYQALNLCLAGAICASLFVIELSLRRFQVLPLLFPGMFAVRERRFYFFNFDISDGSKGKRIRSEAKMLLRITICVVLSYLWEHCVLATKQKVGTEFPESECKEGHDCFASDFHFVTFFNHQHEAVNCAEKKAFEHRVVVSCIRFITPSATTWLMHLAIAHSITQLNFKAFEVMVWVGGNSRWTRRGLAALVFITLSVFLGLFFGGVMSEFVSSWLSFVMSLSVPAFLYVVYKSSKVLDGLWQEDASRVQKDIEDHLSSAFKDIESTIFTDSDEPGVGEISEAPGPKTDVKQGRSSKKLVNQMISAIHNFTRVKTDSSGVSNHQPSDGTWIQVGQSEVGRSPDSGDDVDKKL